MNQHLNLNIPPPPRRHFHWLFAFIFAFSALAHAQQQDEEQSRHIETRVGNVLVIANKNRPDSIEIATEYCRARSLPAANLLRIDTTDPININGSDYNSRIQAAVDQRLRELGPTVDYIVITRGVPYRVNKQSVTAALAFGGLKNILSEQPFYEQQRPFDGSLPCHGTFMKPATALITYTVQDALRLIQRSLVTYPSPQRGGMFYFCNGVGPRGIRNRLIPLAIARLHALGANATHDMEPNLANRLDIIAQSTGIPTVKMTGNVYLPGALLDNVTSWGGYLLDPRGHTTLTEMARHGVCGAYGTVVEPTNIATRWPTFTLPMHYASGFNLADSYLASLRDISLGVILGDPLMAPFSTPPDVKLEWTPAKNESLNAEGTLTFRATAAGENNGIIWGDLWLDDQIRVASFTPSVPAESVVRLQILSKGRTIASKRIVLEHDTPMPAVLGQLTEKTPGKPVQIFLGGDHGCKLLIRSATPDSGALQARLEIRTDGTTRTATIPLVLRPVVSNVAVFEASGPDAQKGDRITVRIGEETADFEADRPMATPDVLEQLALRLNRLPDIGPNKNWTVLVPGPATPFRGRQMWFVPSDQKKQLSTPIVVTIERANGSLFARGFKNGPLPWKMMPVAGLAETVLTAPPLAESVEHSLRISKGSLSPGFHRFQCIAAAGDGSQTIETMDLVLPGKHQNVENWAKIKGDTYDPGDELTVLLEPPKHLNRRYPVLVLDGRPVAIWEHDSSVVSLDLKLPLVCPGQHEAWIEWQKSRRLPSAGVRRTPLARSMPFRFRVRRPLNYDLTWSPKKAKPGTVKLTLTGSYLHEEVDVLVNGQTARLVRSPGHGDKWTVELNNLNPGEHSLLLRGIREWDTPTELAAPLVIESPKL
jgi:uncharacterized protein (TIGR03790 family)